MKRAELWRWIAGLRAPELYRVAAAVDRELAERSERGGRMGERRESARIGREVAAVVARELGVRLSAMRARSKREVDCWPRMLAMALALEAGASWQGAGDAVNRGHRTVWWARKRVAERASVDVRWAATVERVRAVVLQEFTEKTEPERPVRTLRKAA